MCVRDFNECRCRCHDSDNVKHIMACCYGCPVCRKRIKTFSYDSHVAACEKKDMDSLNEFMQEKYGRGPTEEEVQQWKTARNMQRFLRRKPQSP